MQNKRNIIGVKLNSRLVLSPVISLDDPVIYLKPTFIMTITIETDLFTVKKSVCIYFNLL